MRTCECSARVAIVLLHSILIRRRPTSLQKLDQELNSDGQEIKTKGYNIIHNSQWQTWLIHFAPSFVAAKFD